MSYRRIRVSRIYVIGRIWQPDIGTCAQTINLSSYDERNIGEPTRENVEQWLATHAGEFQEIIDFEADIGNAPLIPWAQEESEFTFSDCMFPHEEHCMTHGLTSSFAKHLTHTQSTCRSVLTLRKGRTQS